MRNTIVFVVQLLSCVRLSVTLWTVAYQAALFFIISWSLLKFTSMSQWCYMTVSSSATLFSFCLQSFPVSGSSSEFTLASGGHSIGASASDINIQGWFPLGLTGLISLQLKGLFRVFSRIIVQKRRFFSAQSLWFNAHICTWLLGKPQLWLDGPLLAKRCLCFLICYLGWS